MKTFKSLSFVLMTAALSLTACDTPSDGPGPETGEKKLMLSVDKTSIMSDGRDKATFTVKYGTEEKSVDVTSDAVIMNGTAAIEGSTFTSTTPETYTFTATYEDPESGETVTSNEVTVTASSLTLSVDAETIVSNGLGKATFTVTYEGEDVTATSTITNVTLGEEYAQGANEFVSPSYVGEFEFTAKYRNLTSNTVKVTVEAAPAAELRLVVDKPRLQSGESATFTVLDKGTDVTASAKIKNVTSGDYLDGATFTMGSDKTVQFVAEYNDKTSQTLSVGSGNFHKSVMVLKFTSIGCSYCPQMATALEKANESYDNGTRMVEVSVHHPNMGSDPMIPANIDEFNSYFFRQRTTGLPQTYYDMDLLSYSLGAESTSAILGKVKPLARTVAGVGIAADAEADGSNLKVNVNVTASVANEYYLAVMLLENGIVHSQSGGGDNYVHNHTLRETLSESIFGDSLGAMTVGQTVSKEYSITANAEYEIDNCSIVCYVCTKSGDVWSVSNVVSFPVGSWADVTFE